MQFSRKNITDSILFLVSAVYFLAIISCGGSNAADSNANQNSSGNSSNAENVKATKDNVEELSNLIKMPETPEEAVWREDETQNPKGKKLTAVLKYTAETAGKVTENAAAQQPSEVEIGTEDWFPEELTAQTQLSGNESLKGNSFAASGFLNPPYAHGKLVKVQNTDYFVLELTTY